MESRKTRTPPVHGNYPIYIHFQWQHFRPPQSDPHTVTPYSPYCWGQTKEKNIPVDSHQLALQDNTIPGPHRRICLQSFLPSSTHSQLPFHWNFVTSFVWYVHKHTTFQIRKVPNHTHPKKKYRWKGVHLYHLKKNCRWPNSKSYTTSSFLPHTQQGEHLKPLAHHQYQHTDPRLKAFCFFHFLFSLYQIHFSKKKNWRKVVFWMLPKTTRITFWTVVVLNIMQFLVDISVLDTGKYRKLVLTGEVYWPWRGDRVWKEYMF